MINNQLDFYTIIINYMGIYIPYCKIRKMIVCFFMFGVKIKQIYVADENVV